MYKILFVLRYKTEPKANLHYVETEIVKAVIPAAGLGTRFLPLTKAQPKEMVPILDKPAIQYVIEEAYASGLTDLLVITGKNKRAIEDHFDRSIDLEKFLEQHGQLDLLKRVMELNEFENIFFTRQASQRGLGDAILCAKKHVGQDFFAVLLADDILVGGKTMAEMKNLAQRHNASVIALTPVPDKEISNYGIALLKQSNAEPMLIEKVVEKPEPKDVVSNLAIIGRYVLSPEIFDCLSELKPGKKDEIQLTDAIEVLIQRGNRVLAYITNETRLDVGNVLGFLKANITLAMRDFDLAKELKSFLSEFGGNVANN